MRKKAGQCKNALYIGQFGFGQKSKNINISCIFFKTVDIMYFICYTITHKKIDFVFTYDICD